MSTQARKDASYRWSKAHMGMCATTVHKDTVALFRQYCAQRGESIHAVLKRYVEECISTMDPPPDRPSDDA